VKIDPFGYLLNTVIDLSNLALSPLSSAKRGRIGAHTCPGDHLGSTRSAGVDYAASRPPLVELQAGNVSIARPRDRARRHVLHITPNYLKSDQRIMVGVTLRSSQTMRPRRSAGPWLGPAESWRSCDVD
jgi:hypothetical protein